VAWPCPRRADISLRRTRALSSRTKNFQQDLESVRVLQRSYPVLGRMRLGFWEEHDPFFHIMLPPSIRLPTPPRTAGAVDEQLLKMNRRVATKLSDNEHSVPSSPLMLCGGYYARSSSEAANKGSYF
jgi:hypothetical protein